MSDDRTNHARDAFIVGTLLAEGRATAGAAESGPEAAKGAFLTAILASDPEWSPRASYALGQMLWLNGDADEALRHLKVALNAGHLEWSPAAAVLFGVILTSRGDVALASQAYQKAIASRHPVHAARGWFNLGTLHQQRGETEWAIEAFRQAMASDSSDTSEFKARAAVNLGFILFNHVGDIKGARQAFQQAIATGHPEQSLLAAMNLQSLEENTKNAAWESAPIVRQPGDIDIGRGSGSLQYQHWIKSSGDALPSNDRPTGEVGSGPGSTSRLALQRAVGFLQRLGPLFAIFGLRGRRPASRSPRAQETTAASPGMKEMRRFIETRVETGQELDEAMSAMDDLIAAITSLFEKDPALFVSEMYGVQELQARLLDRMGRWNDAAKVRAWIQQRPLDQLLKGPDPEARRHH